MVTSLILCMSTLWKHSWQISFGTHMFLGKQDRELAFLVDLLCFSSMQVFKERTDSLPVIEHDNSISKGNLRCKTFKIYSRSWQIIYPWNILVSSIGEGMVPIPLAFLDSSFEYPILRNGLAQWFYSSLTQLLYPNWISSLLCVSFLSSRGHAYPPVTSKNYGPHVVALPYSNPNLHFDLNSLVLALLL